VSDTSSVPRVFRLIYRTVVTLYNNIVIIITIRLSMVLRIGEISQLQVSCIVIGLVLDEERQLVGFVLWGDGWFQVKYVLVEIGSRGGSTGFELGVRNLAARLRVRIVNSGVCQSVAFLRAGAFAHDVYVFGVAGAIGTDDAHLNQHKFHDRSFHQISSFTHLSSFALSGVTTARCAASGAFCYL
jgi:hypothetical protein